MTPSLSPIHTVGTIWNLESGNCPSPTSAAASPGPESSSGLVGESVASSLVPGSVCARRITWRLNLPSRGEYNEYFANLSASIWTDFRLPDFTSFMGPLSELMEAFDNIMS